MTKLEGGKIKEQRKKIRVDKTLEKNKRKSKQMEERKLL